MNKVPRLYALHCTECKTNIAFAYTEMEQPSIYLCHSCASMFARVTDTLRGDRKEFAAIELRRFKTLALASPVAGDIVSGVQTTITLRRENRDAISCDNIDINTINNLTIT